MNNDSQDKREEAAVVVMEHTERMEYEDKPDSYVSQADEW